MTSNAPPTTSSEHNALDGAIIIVNYRTAELVERCLASVRATRGELRLEIVVIDNASNDGSVEQLRASQQKHERESLGVTQQSHSQPHTRRADTEVIAMAENRGFAAGVNAGFRNTHAQTVVVLNPDTELHPGALQALLAHLLEHPRTGIVAPLLEDADGRLAPNGYRRFPSLFTLALDMCLPAGYALAHAPSLHPYAMAPAALLAGRPPAHVCGAAMAIRRAAYDQAGPFDESFFLYLEETEWQRRVVAQGWAIELLPSARVCHLVRSGGAEAHAPSPHFVDGALRYLRLRGVPQSFARAILAMALASSWMTLRLIACLPTKRHRATSQARAYWALLRGTLTGTEAPRGASPPGRDR
jgi:N-acetylglucosaminyl-diphospho-decaprenol L-rhamnosyltransferase